MNFRIYQKKFLSDKENKMLEFLKILIQNVLTSIISILLIENETKRIF